jgi:YYY domain-containing protein
MTERASRTRTAKVAVRKSARASRLSARKSRGGTFVRARKSSAPSIENPTLQRLSALGDSRALTIALVVVLLLGAWFRFHGLNWDEGRHLHPDERFLSSVTNDIKWPQNLDTYFDPAASTLSPYSLPNVGLFVYGTLPVYIVKWVSILLNKNNYDAITLVGRALSGIFDLAAILMLFMIARRLYGRGVALLAATLLALSVFNIQLSHFYAVDTYANLFIVATLYFVLRAADTGRWMDYALTGLMLGLGLASKVTVLTLAAPILVGIGLDYYRQARASDARSALEHTVVRLLTVVLLAAVTFRVAQPIAFAGPGFWNWSFNPRWLRDLVEQQKTVSGAADQPWIQQWTDRSIFFPLYNIVVWGLGWPLGLASLAGFGLAVFELLKKRRLEHLLPVIYVTITFIYHAATFVKFMRYFLPIYPFLALFAAYLIVWLWQKAFAAEEFRATHARTESAGSRVHGLLARVFVSRAFAAALAAVVIAGTLLYAAAFSTIYSRRNTRVAASHWMYEHISPGSTLANEHWDDWLPIGGVDGKTAYGDQGVFKSVEMANYEDDTPAKLDKMVQNLSSADYVILSSNRLYLSIPRLPMRYPMTIRYYQMLFSGQLGFEPVAVFTSYPQLFGIQIPDQVAEESFSVYDHPKVQIFKKTAAFNPDAVRQALGQGIAWSQVIHLTPLQATQAPNGLQLSSTQQARYQQAAITSSAEVNPDGVGSRLPLLAWFLVLIVIGLVALPLTLVAFSRLPDRGYLFTKAIGLLLVAWAAWMIASLRLAPFTWWVILVMLALLGIASAILAWRHWPTLRRFVQARWRLLLLEEAVFWVFFLLMLYVRLHNPDLWHPSTGGEKPMDLAYLDAIVRTPYFPSYDPWFAGGYINYYYFGFVLVAALIHLTGIVPYIAYNLAVPTFFALTAAGGFTAALGLAQCRRGAPYPGHRRRLSLGTATLLAGVCGALFVAVIGNLAQVKLLWDGILGLSTLSATAGGSFFGTIAKFADGVNQWISGRPLPIHTDWWYWNATRVIPAAQGEAGPINEMPFFTFLFADLHAHAMALPYTLLAVALSLNVLLDAPHRRTTSFRSHWWQNPAGMLTLGLLAITTGALWPMNTWDFPTYTLLAGAALTFGEIGRRGRIDAPGVATILWRLALITLGGWLLFLPFHQNYASAYFGAELWKGSRTPLWAYLLIHGFFLFVLASYLLAELFVGRSHNAVVRSLRLNLRNWRHPGRLHRAFERITKPTPGYRLAVLLSQIALVLVVIVLVLDSVVGLALGLSLLAGLLLWSSRPDPRRQFMLFMIGFGLLLTAVVEVVVLKGDISRMNTVFKFYLQVWVMWAVVSAAVLPEMAARLNDRRLPEEFSSPRSRAAALSPAGISPHRRRLARRPVGAWAQRWWWAFGLLLGACLLYPLTAAPVRVSDRFKDSKAVTLDGTSYMHTSVYFDDGRPITLEWDRQAIDWLRRNVQGIPTILEANTPLYRWGSRVSIYTGFPTVIGWDWHQKQQRSVMPGQIVDRRIEDVRTLYNGTDLTQTMQLITQYNIKYVYVGPLEKIYYDATGLAKFDQPNPAWSLVYQNDQVKIYQIHE